jgi:ABC-2 type transport system ATP-binding protein
MLERVQSVCDRVALFNKGSIVLIGTIPELGHQVLGGGFHVELEAEGQGLVERLANVPGVTAVEAIGTNRMRLLAQHDVRVQDAAAAVIAASGRLLGFFFNDTSPTEIYTRYFLKKALH